jgi:transcriptional regulator with XRE-family HTH domain
MDMRKLVGRNFGRLRKEKGFTQERFAEISGFTQQYVSGLERGRRNPTVVTLFHLAKEWAKPRGRKSHRRRCGSGDRGVAGLRPDQANERPGARVR